MHPIILKLLEKKGIREESEIAEFLSGKPQKTYDPFLLLNMEAGVDLILSSIDDGEKICIYGDYDADGITSTAVLIDILSELTDNLMYYIPSRFDEGYGLNCEALKTIKDSGTDLVITVDCGSVSCAEVEYAKKIGLKILVTDHHTIDNKKANCLVINPKQKECTYPFKGLAGVGVAFKLAQAITLVTGLPKSTLNRTLDLVGIGTIGDIVPLVDENRTLAKYGIRAIKVSQRPGLMKLIDSISVDRNALNSWMVSFGIVPHLNAAGRMESAQIAASLMMEKDESKVNQGVSQLVELNKQRKSIQEDTYEFCKEKIEQEYKDDKFLLVDLDEAHEGITGIVAGKVKETYNKPTIIVTDMGDGLYKGTGRSVDNVNLYELLKENEELFERFGGHSAACGFTMKQENLELLRKNLNESMEKIISMNPSILEESIPVDAELTAEDITATMVKELKLLEPFGCENQMPTFGITGTPGNIQYMGKNGQYTRFQCALSNGNKIQFVIFKDARSYDYILQEGLPVHIKCTLALQNWKGKEYIQGTVLDITSKVN